MDRLMGLRTFALVAELRSFTAAASRLGLSPAMTSKHVLHLEQRLGTRLLNRTSRRVGLTETGARYLEQVLPALVELEAADAALGEAAVAPSGVLRMTAPVWMAGPRFATMLAAYIERYPAVVPDISFDGRLVDLVAVGIDLALRVTASPDPGLIARRIRTVTLRLVGSPDLLARTGSPATLDDLDGRDLLAYSIVQPGNHMTWDWPEGRRTIQFRVVARSDNEAFLRAAALAGMGLAFMPDWLVDDDLRTGALVELLPGRAAIQGPLFAIYPDRRYVPAKVRTFIDFVIGWCPHDRVGPDRRGHSDPANLDPAGL
jgi:DNA-binding transcriptional LysR family regulator